MRIVLLLLLSCFQFDAYPCEAHLAQAEGELSETYQIVWAQAGGDRKALLERAQVAWYHYRQANCEIVVARDAEADCLASMTVERARELRSLGVDRYERSYYFVQP